MNFDEYIHLGNHQPILFAGISSEIALISLPSQHPTDPHPIRFLSLSICFAFSHAVFMQCVLFFHPGQQCWIHPRCCIYQSLIHSFSCSIELHCMDTPFVYPSTS